jgi:hypothetical protein
MEVETTMNTDQGRRPGIAEAQAVAREFLMSVLPDVQRVDITKVAPMTIGEATWEVEAGVWQPNATLKSLGIETGRPVLDHNRYLILLDAMLNVVEYELEGPSRGKN